MEKRFVDGLGTSKIKVQLELEFSDEIENLTQLRKNILSALIDQIDGRGLAPEDDEAITTSVTVGECEQEFILGSIFRANCE